MLKKVFAAVLGIALAVGSAACGEQKSEGPDYADDEAMNIIAEGFGKRSALIDKLEGEGKDTTESDNLRQVIQAEIDNDRDLKTRPFKNSKMQEDVISYINLLNDQLGIMRKYSSTSSAFTTRWQETYDKRSALLKTFVDKYGMKIDAKYQDALDELVRNGNSVQEKNKADQAINGLISSATFEKTPDEYGGSTYTYSAVIENTSGISFGNVSLVLALYDAGGVKAEETYASTSSWAAGEKVRFEAIGSVDAAQVKASVSNYEVAE